MSDEEKKPKTKPLDEKEKERIKFFITSPLRSADKLKKQLYADDTFFRQTAYAWVGENDAKKLFFYGVCIEVGKACIEMMQTEGLFEEVPAEKEAGSDTGRLVHNAIVDRQNALIRKLTELLSLVINFTKTTNDVEYRIFHSAQNLNRFLNQQKSFRDVFGVEKSNTQSSIDDYKKRVDDDIVLNNNQIPWFIDQQNLKRLKPSVFKGWMSFYMDAIDISNDDEKAMLGISHERYSMFSQNVHPTLTSHDYADDEDWDSVLANISYISLLAMHIMGRSYDILGLKDDDGIKKIMGENFEKSDASRMMSMFAKSFEVGDIVFAHSNDLAEIVECKTGKFGYTVYKIKYLSNPPLPQYPEDWIEGRRLTRIFKPEHIRPFFAKSLEPSSTLPDVVKDTIKQMLTEKDDVLIGLMKQTLAGLHKDGILVMMLVNSNIIKPIGKKPSSETTPEEKA